MTSARIWMFCVLLALGYFMYEIAYSAIVPVRLVFTADQEWERRQLRAVYDAAQSHDTTAVQIALRNMSQAVAKGQIETIWAE